MEEEDFQKEFHFDGVEVRKKFVVVVAALVHVQQNSVGLFPSVQRPRCSHQPQRLDVEVEERRGSLLRGPRPRRRGIGLLHRLLVKRRDFPLLPTSSQRGFVRLGRSSVEKKKTNHFFTFNQTLFLFSSHASSLAIKELTFAPRSSRVANSFHSQELSKKKGKRRPESKKSKRALSSQSIVEEFFPSDLLLRTFFFFESFPAEEREREQKMRSESIAGWCALVTGASSGIGAATAKALAEEKCNLVLVARRQERLEALKAEILSSSSSSANKDIKIHTAVLDVRDARAVSEFLETLPDEFKNIDILVNNAGLALGVDKVSELKDEDVATMVETNCLALARFTRLVTPGMVARDRGHVVNIGSVAGSYHYGGGAAYCATKAFVLAFTNAARSDLVDSQVRVTLISPGAVKTEFGGVRYKGDEEAANKVYEGIDALSADDCADAVVYSVTRPANCQVGDVTLWATRQATPQVYGRRK